MTRPLRTPITLAQWAYLEHIDSLPVGTLAGWKILTPHRAKMAEELKIPKDLFHILAKENPLSPEEPLIYLACLTRSGQHLLQYGTIPS